MRIKTKYHNEVEINQMDIWYFNKGIPGFPEEKNFIILSLPDNQVFSILQSVSTPEIAFVITNPFLFYKTYEFTIEDFVKEHLELENEKDVQVYIILTVHDPFEKTTANLQAPLILNTRNHKGKQLILNDSIYKTKHPLLQTDLVKVEG